MISREYPPDTGWGGIATFANHLAQGLKELGHEVEVIALAKDKAKPLPRKIEQRLNELGPTLEAALREVAKRLFGTKEGAERQHPKWKELEKSDYAMARIVEAAVFSDAEEEEELKEQPAAV